MLKAWVFGMLLATSAGSFAGPAQPPAPSHTSIGSDEAAIRAARNELNAALVSKDLGVVAKYWLQDAHTTGGGGSLWVGRDRNIEGFAKIFHGGDFLSGIRTPERIEVATGGPREAAESGVWEWRMRKSGQVLTYRGRYLVMWQKMGLRWLIRSELYVTTGCTGGNACS